MSSSLNGEKTFVIFSEPKDSKFMGAGWSNSLRTEEYDFN